MRKLATIRQISDLQPILEADKIECATVDGWKVVVQKGKHVVGEKIIFFEIDSFLPLKPEYEFLRKSCHRTMNNIEGFRIRTVKFKKQLSQGLVLSLDFEAELGDDVTEKLGVMLWEDPILSKVQEEIIGHFPWFIPKTDAERCLSGDILLITNNGSMPIKDICESIEPIQVLTLNHLTYEFEYCDVINRSIMRNNHNWFLIETEHGYTIKCTKNHRIWCENLQCYRRADQLDGSDIMYIVFSPI